VIAVAEDNKELSDKVKDANRRSGHKYGKSGVAA